jgi:hypothetical protein
MQRLPANNQQQEDTNIGDPGWRAPVVPSWPDAHIQPAQTLSALHHASAYQESAYPPTTLSVPLSSTANAPIYPSPIHSVTISISASTKVASLNTGITTLSTTAISTVTVLTTVLVQPTTRSVALQGSLPSTTNAAATEAIQPTTPNSMPPTVQIGLGVGIAVCVLSLAGVAAFYIWRRRKHSNHDDTLKVDRRIGFKKYFTFGRYRNNKDDAEWSIESVEKVAIVGKVRAQSVLTISRSNSRRSNGTSENGTRVVAIHGRAPTMALHSHPMTPSYTAFDTGASGTKLSVSKDVSKHEEEQRSSSWPLDK